MSIPEPSGIDPSHIAGTNFIMLHLDLLDVLDGDFYAALLLDRIRFRAGTDGWWTATRSQLLAETRMSEYQFKRALQHLRDVGYVQTERVAAYDATLRYRLLVAENVGTTEKAHSAVSTKHIAPSDVADIAVSEMANTAVSTVTKNSEEQKQEPPLPPKGGSIEVHSASFDEFWKAYPRKDAKKPAQKKWESLVKSHDPAMLIHAAVKYRQWCEREGKPNELILLPTTWLNQERWNDERVEAPAVITEHERRKQGHIALIQELWETDNSPKPQQLEG